MIAGDFPALAMACGTSTAYSAVSPWRSFADVLWHHFESVGTKAYTRRELERLFAAFPQVEITAYLTPYDVQKLPGPALRWLPAQFGMFYAIVAAR